MGPIKGATTPDQRGYENNCNYEVVLCPSKSKRTLYIRIDFPLSSYGIRVDPFGGFNLFLEGVFNKLMTLYTKVSVVQGTFKFVNIQ